MTTGEFGGEQIDPSDIVLNPGDDVVNLHFNGALAQEFRFLMQVEELTPDELLRVSIENYSMYKALTGLNRPVIVKHPTRDPDTYAGIVEAFDFFPELRFVPPVDVDESDVLEFSVLFTAEVKQPIADVAELCGIDFDAFLINALSFERMVARLKANSFQPISLSEPGSRDGQILDFA